MARESKAAKKSRVLKILKKLHGTYPDADCSLDYKNPLQLLVATILSAQCTDARVNMVTPLLFKKYKTAKDFSQSPPGQLESEIRSTGFFNNKAKSIRSACQSIHENYEGKVPQTMDELLSLAGVARKTANVVLGTAFEIADGVVVDTHVGRISNLLGLTRQKDPKKVEKDLMDILPRKEWIFFSHALVHHGRGPCKARRPDCQNCDLNKLCPHALRGKEMKTA